MTEHYPERIGEHGLRMQEFRFLQALLIKHSNFNEVINKFEEKKSLICIGV